MAGTKKKQATKPEGAIRKSQVVTTFGPGAMVDLVDQAVLIGGLDFWSYDKKKPWPSISEPRLRESLLPLFKKMGRELSAKDPFREPPVGDDREPHLYAGIKALEFPQWSVCQNADCRALVRKSDLERKKARYVHSCPTGKRAFETVPVRFLGACKNGHTQDWPWIDFVHLEQPGGRCSATPSLRLTEGSTGDFSEVRVSCLCGASQPLKTALAGPALTCRGRRPWLGEQGDGPCNESLRLLVRTASNSYFAQVVSALSIPEPGKEMEDAILEHQTILFSANENTLPAFRTIPDVSKAIAPYSDAQVLAAIATLKNGQASVRSPLRSAEFKQLVSSPLEKPGDRPGPDDEFHAREVRPKEGVPEGVSRIVIAQRLREVRVQIGFTRIDAATPDLQGEYDIDVKSASLGLNTNWLPATEIWGEGVFLQLDEARVQAWEARPAVRERTKELQKGFKDWVKTLRLPSDAPQPPFPGVRFYMLHSLAHLLISAISLECGYAASAIRERIYCGPSRADENTPMAAILLSTGASGTEGTLGGLVEQGRRVREHLRRSWDLGRLCSNDPVCAGHRPHDDPSERHLEGAACHGCLFIAECSCERFNRYLDRALVVPTVGHDDSLAFFSTRP
jgi:hypothetical protein